MKLLRNIPLRRAWYALILLASLLPAIALSPWLSHQAHGLLLDRAMLREEIFHKELEMRLYLETKRLVSVLQNKSDPLAYFLKQGGQRQIMLELIKKIDARESVVNSTTIYNVDARVILSNHQGKHVVAEINRNTPAFVIPMHQRVFIGSPSRLADGHYAFLIGVPLITDGNTLGVMISTININDFWNSVKSGLPGHVSNTYLVDGRGSLLVRQAKSHVKQGELLSNQSIVRTLLAHQDWHRTEAYTGFEGTDVFGIGTHVRELQWGLISEIPSQYIVSPIISALITLTLIVMLIHLLFGLITLLFSGRLINPISALAASMKQAAGGDYSHHVQASRYREIKQLGDAFSGMIDEIYQREKALNKFTLAIEHLGEAILITDCNGIIEYVNPAFTQMNGYALEEALGQTPKIMNSGTQPESFYKKFWSSIKDGKVWEGRLVNRSKDGALYPVLMSVAPIYANNTITHFVAVQQNMTEQDSLQDQLRQSQKMEAIGTLVGGIAHDFNNMLAGMTGNLYLAKRMAQDNPDMQVKLENIDQLSLRAAAMIQQLLTFARKDRVNMQAFQFDAFVKETLGFLKTSVPENIKLNTDLCNLALPVLGDETQLHQVLMNLINNARDAVEELAQPMVTIKLESRHIDAMQAAQKPSLEAGDFAHLSVTDNGIGIPESQLEHLFEPFFTTKEQGKGTGLGLSMVFGAVQTHGGFIDVKSKPGKGSAFHIYIPLQQNVTPVEHTVQTEPAIGGAELILLADDEQFVRETMAEVLDSLGYKVLQAEDGLEAMALFQAHSEEVAMVISDMVMPNCSGLQLAEQICSDRPDMPIIFVTGYDREAMIKGSGVIRNCEIISKPVQFDDLSGMIRQLLGASKLEY